MKFLLVTLCIFFTNHLFAGTVYEYKFAGTVYQYKNAQGETVITNKERKDPSFKLIRATKVPDGYKAETKTNAETIKATRQIILNKDGSFSDAPIGSYLSSTSDASARILLNDDETRKPIKPDTPNTPSIQTQPKEVEKLITPKKIETPKYTVS